MDEYWASDRIDIAKYVGGLPDCCFEDCEHVVLRDGPWTETVKMKLGDMQHAFPKVKMTHSSFERDLEDKQYLMFMSDGDLGMLTYMRQGLGNGLCAINRSGIPTAISGCAFHKIKTISLMCNRYINEAKANALRYKREYTKSARDLLNGEAEYYRLFGGLLDQCMNTDDPKIGLLCWKMLLMKARLLRMEKFAAHIDRFHHPKTGRQGTWGRWNQVQEQAIGRGGPDDYGLDTAVAYGTTSTSNPLEARMNKLMKIACGTSMSYGALSTKAQFMCTNLSQDMSELGFSLVADQQGQCAKAAHRKPSGMPGTQPTGRDYKKRFIRGVENSRKKVHQLYNHRVRGKGVTAEYYCASEITKIEIGKFFKYEGKESNAKDVAARVKVLRESWVECMKDPDKYVEHLLEVSDSCAFRRITLSTLRVLLQTVPTWNVARARRHRMKEKAYRGADVWTGSDLQVFLLVERDFLYYTRAFHHVVPATPLTKPEAAEYMQECWRKSDLVQDLGFFMCRHCNQYAKHRFCEEVRPPTPAVVTHYVVDLPFVLQCVTVAIAEGLMPDLPLAFQTRGFESGVTNVNPVQKYDKFGVPQELTTPEKTRQRFKNHAR